MTSISFQKEVLISISCVIRESFFVKPYRVNYRKHESLANMLCFLLIRAGNNSNLTPMIGKLKEPRAQTHSVTYPYKYCGIVNNKYFACSHGGLKISIDFKC